MKCRNALETADGQTARAKMFGVSRLAERNAHSVASGLDLARTGNVRSAVDNYDARDSIRFRAREDSI